MSLGILHFIYTIFGEITYHSVCWTYLYNKISPNMQEKDIFLDFDCNKSKLQYDYKKYIEIFKNKYSFYNNKNIIIIDNYNLNNSKNTYKNIELNTIKLKKQNKIALLIKRFRKTKDDDYITWYNSRQWYTNMKFTNNIEAINIKSYDNLKLNGVLVKNNIENNNNFVIVVHGYGGNYFCHLDIGYGFYKYLGCNVLFITHRGYKYSSGNYTSLGWKESYDIYKWIQYIVKKYPKANIILWGISMGGTSVLMTSSMNLPKNVKLCISDCAFNCFSDLCKTIVKKAKLSKTIGYPLISSMCTIARLNNTNLKFKVQNYLKKSKLPILFIHGTSDELIPFKHSVKLFDTYNNDKRLLLVKYADHCKASIYAQDLYWSTIYDFAKNYIDF